MKKNLTNTILYNCKQTVQDILFYIISRLSSKMMASILYKREFRKPLNWKAPIDLNEKINWLKFYSDTAKWTLLTDKYRVREYVKSCGLEHLLVKLYGKWDNVKDIDWEQLPNKFIMKTNNGSGDVFICEDKSKLNINKCKRHFNALMRKTFGYEMGEPHYKKIKPCIIAEELLDVKKQPIVSSSLIDYKIWSFDGKPAYIWACFNRTPHSVEVGIYDLDWNFHPEYSRSTSHYVLSHSIPKPKSLDKMLEAASVLSKGFPELRVDLYEVDGKPYFGELTFTSAGGINNFYTDEFLKILGDLTDLKAKKDE